MVITNFKVKPEPCGNKINKSKKEFESSTWVTIRNSWWIYSIKVHSLQALCHSDPQFYDKAAKNAKSKPSGTALRCIRATPIQIPADDKNICSGGFEKKMRGDEKWKNLGGRRFGLFCPPQDLKWNSSNPYLARDTSFITPYLARYSWSVTDTEW